MIRNDVLTGRSFHESSVGRFNTNETLSLARRWRICTSGPCDPSSPGFCSRFLPLHSTVLLALRHFLSVILCFFFFFFPFLSLLVDFICWFRLLNLDLWPPDADWRPMSRLLTPIRGSRGAPGIFFACEAGRKKKKKKRKAQKRGILY